LDESLSFAREKDMLGKKGTFEKKGHVWEKHPNIRTFGWGSFYGILDK
jgi:hypothetical protein